MTRSASNDALAARLAQVKQLVCFMLLFNLAELQVFLQMQESIVLLKNDGGLLPVAQSSTLTSVVVFGDESTVHGSGSGGVTMPFVSLISASLKQMGHNATYSTVTDPSAAATLAKAASLVVVAVSVATGEGMDRTTLSLSGGRAKVPYDQDKLVAAIGAAAGKKTVVVARCSGAFAMPWLGSVAALLYQLMPGQGGGVQCVCSWHENTVEGCAQRPVAVILPCDRTQPLEKLCRDDSSGRWLECRQDSDPEEPREWIVWLVAACVALVLVR
eukprot:SAG25_NODE_878_length_4974_cov_1.376615_4_plen_272_part_00